MNPNESSMKCEGCNCKCRHHYVTPLSLVLIGLAFIAANLGWITMDFANLTWPFLLVVIGVGKFCSCCSQK